MNYFVVSKSVEKTLQKKDREEPGTMLHSSGLKMKLKLKLKAKLKIKTFSLSQKYFIFDCPPASGQFCYRFIPLKNIEAV